MSEIICRCKGVTKEKIEEAIRNGATTLDDIEEATNAMSGCGSCTKKVQDLLDENTQK